MKQRNSHKSLKQQENSWNQGSASDRFQVQENENKQIENIRVGRKGTAKYSQHKQGKWKQEQDQIYVNFILSNRQKLASKAIRRSTRVFRQLAQKLNFQRTPQQCRMHHQRMKRKARGRSINAIAKFIQKKYKKINQVIKEKELGKFQLSKQLKEEKKVEQCETTYVDQDSGVQIKIKRIVEFGISVMVSLDMISQW